MIELAGIIILGILAQWVSWRTKVPAILPLILIGLLVGPIATLWTHDGVKLIEPIFNQESGKGLFPGQSLFYFVSLSIGIILFEGGLTLKLKEIKGVGPAIIRLITAGSLITFIGAGLAAHFIMNLSWQISFLFAGLIIVTGPTVIAPILQNVPLTRNVSTVLKWEGILIDPIGALTAVLVFDFIISGEGMEFSSHAFIEFFRIVFIGLSAGGLAALGLKQLIVRNLVPHYLLNVVTLASVLLVFVLCDILAPESGLLGVVVMGMVMGNLDVPKIKDILDFKESLSVLLISILFILLAANIDMQDLMLLQNWKVAALFAVVVFVLRPLGVIYSTRGSNLSFNEKLFISWVGPRGIVAAGIASLFGIKLMLNGTPQAEYITPLVFIIVLGTVLLNATTARMVARLLGVIQDKSSGIMIVGANSASRLIGKYLMDNNRHVVMVDNNAQSLKKAADKGLETLQANIFSDDLNEHFELTDMGYILAMTSSQDVNEQAIKRFEATLGENGSYRLPTSDEIRKTRTQLPANGLLAPADDFINLLEVVRDYPAVYEMPLQSKEQFVNLMKNINRLSESIPMFLKRADGSLDVVSSHYENMTIEEGDELVYVGQELENTGSNASTSSDSMSQ